MKTKEEIAAHFAQITEAYLAAQLHVWTVIFEGEPATSAYDEVLREAKLSATKLHGELRGLAFALDLDYWYGPIAERIDADRAQYDAHRASAVAEADVWGAMTPSERRVAAMEDNDIDPDSEPDQHSYEPGMAGDDDADEVTAFDAIARCNNCGGTGPVHFLTGECSACFGVGIE